MVYLTTYTILHMYDVIPYQVYHFTSREVAEAWAAENGYKVAESPDDSTECTIDFVTFEG